VLGIGAGFVWAAVAPRALLQEVTRGEAQVVNAETSAFIGADAWFCLIAAVGGVITGVVGYRVLVRRAGWVATAGLALGAVAAALLAMWVGENTGLGTYNHLLASSSVGTFFRASLSLSSKSALAFWPLLTCVVILVAESGARRTGQPEPVDHAP
jgi:urea transporter